MERGKGMFRVLREGGTWEDRSNSLSWVRLNPTSDDAIPIDRESAAAIMRSNVA